MSESVKTDIINYIRRNRVSTTEVADCLGKKGVIEGVYPLTTQQHKVGEIFYTYAVKESNWHIHRDLTNDVEGKVVFMDAIDVNGRALVGELVAKYTILYREAIAIVSNGKMRDAHALKKEKFPVWCKGVSPVGCFNNEVQENDFYEIIETHRRELEGAVAVCDDSGVVVIAKDLLTEDFLQKLIEIEKQEDIWFDCIDRLKWNTFETVCEKKYKERDYE